MNPPTTPSLSITWQHPTYLLPLFCLAPLLGASNSLTIAIAISIVMLIATTGTTLILFALQPYTKPAVLVVIGLIVSSAMIATLELLIHAWNYELYRTLGLFLPLIIIASLLVTRAEMLERQMKLGPILCRTLKMNGGFFFAAVILGSAREIIGHGTLLHDAAKIFGQSWQSVSITLFRSDMGFLLSVLAPGAFIGFGIGVALYNWVWLHLPRKNVDHAQR